MTLLFDKHRLIVSPGLAPAQLRDPDEFDSRQNSADTVLTIGLVNNMPDTALQATERQFMRLLRDAAGNMRIHFHCFSLPSVQPIADRAAACRTSIHRYRRSRPAADRRIDRHRRRAGRRDAARRAILARPHRHHRMGGNQHTLDDLVVSCRPCRGPASRRHRAATARCKMFGNLRLRQGDRQLADAGGPVAAQDLALAAQRAAGGRSCGQGLSIADRFNRRPASISSPSSCAASLSSFRDIRNTTPCRWSANICATSLAFLRANAIPIRPSLPAISTLRPKRGWHASRDGRASSAGLHSAPNCLTARFGTTSRPGPRQRPFSGIGSDIFPKAREQRCRAPSSDLAKVPSCNWAGLH